MRKFYIFSLALLVHFGLLAQNSGYFQSRVITNPDEGYTTEVNKVSYLPHVYGAYETGGSDNLEVNWQFTDPAAVGSKIVVSDVGTTFNSWWLNNERVSLHENSATPIWESTVLAEWEYPIDMTPDGEYLTVAFDSVVQVFSSSAQSLVWEKIVSAEFTGVKISEDGTKVFTTENAPNGRSAVSAYIVGEDDPFWLTDFEGAGTAFAASGDRSTLVYCQYSGFNKLWVIDATDGAIIYDAFYKNQSAPALSYDGKIILNGDYSGYAYLYEYDEDNETYYEKWNFKVGGGGTSAWVLGMGVSADGSTVAIGTLVFITGGYDGEIYLFNSYSPEPLWVFEHCGDQVGSISLSDDGSLIAAAGYGPLDHSKPDFHLFRKETNDPIFTLTTQGSFFAVDLSSDGMLCSVTGKAVHAREFGSGGILYNVNSNPGGGSIAGIITDENSGEPIANVKAGIEGLDDYYDFTNDEGHYEIKYVPTGTQQVNATKVGYYPGTVVDVPVIEGEVTQLDIMLDQTGNPPDLILASHGTGDYVGLEWATEASGVGFNIYRKTIEEALFPEEPIATLGDDIYTFGDLDVLPLTTYFYAVTQIIEAGVESPYSNTEEGWIASGFVINDISVYYGTTPTIDGTISAGEWDDAFEMDASDFLGVYDNMPNPIGSVMMYYKVNQDMTELYVACINENDVVLEDHDEVALYFDDNGDGTYPPADDNSEGNYWAAYYAAGNELKYRPIYNTGGVGTVVYLKNPQLEVSDATGHIVYEFMIPIGDDEDWKITPNEQNESGMFLFVLDDPSNFDGYWPCQNQQIFEPSGYGDITFGAEDDVPPPPDNVGITNVYYFENILANIEWSQPLINDFDHFTVYVDNGAGFQVLEMTYGTQLFYSSYPTSSAQFYITTVDKSGQESDPSEIVMFDPFVGMDEVELQTKFMMYPNPTSGSATISFTVAENLPTQVSVFDVQGKLVATLLNSEIPSGNYAVSWDGSSDSGEKVSDGIYFVKITNAKLNISKKLILMR